MSLRVALALCAIATLTARAAAPEPTPPAREYHAYVASEAADAISVIRFGPKGLTVDRTLPTGLMPTDIDGPHGVAVSPDGRTYFVSLAHGQPAGAVWKYAVANDAVEAASRG